MNPYYALSAIFALGLRGVEKKLELGVVPVAQMTQEDKKTGKVRWPLRSMVYPKGIAILRIPAR